MACTCGHSEEEHGHDHEYPGSTACTECEDCVAYEADAVANMQAIAAEALAAQPEERG